jgi:hypothetical protein
MGGCDCACANKPKPNPKPKKPKVMSGGSLEDYMQNVDAVTAQLAITT